MSRGARIALVQGGASLVAGGCALALALTSDHSGASTVQALLGELVGLSFTTAGLLGMWRRPANRSGALLALVGYTYFAGALAFVSSSLAVDASAGRSRSSFSRRSSICCSRIRPGR